MSLKNWFLLVILSIVWGGSFFFVEVALVNVPPFTLVFLRVSLAALVLGFYVKLCGLSLPWNGRLWFTLFVMGLLNNAIPFSLLVWGQVYISSGVASILNATTPIFGVLVAHAFTRDERLSVHKGLGVLIGFGGVVIMMAPMLKGGLTWQGYGQIAVMGAAISYAFAGVWGKRLHGTPVMVNAAGMLIASSLIMLPVIFIVETPLAVHFDRASVVLAILGLAIVSTAFAYLLYFRILAEAGATNLLLVTFLVPISAIWLGVAFLGEVLDDIMLYGMATIFLGLALIDGRVLRLFRK